MEGVGVRHTRGPETTNKIVHYTSGGAAGSERGEKRCPELGGKRLHDVRWATRDPRPEKSWRNTARGLDILPPSKRKVRTPSEHEASWKGNTMLINATTSLTCSYRRHHHHQYQASGTVPPVKRCFRASRCKMPSAPADA